MIFKNQIIQQLNVTAANTANDNLFGEKKLKKKKTMLHYQLRFKQ